MKSPKKSNDSIDYAVKDPVSIGEQIRAQHTTPSKIGQHLKDAASVSGEAVYYYTRGLLHTQDSKEQFLQEAQQLFDTSVILPSVERKQVFSALLDQTGRAGSLFVIQNIGALTQQNARACMKDFMDAGGSMPDVALWLQYAGQVLRTHHIKSPDTAGAVVDALGDAAEWLVDALEDGVDAILEAIDAILDAITSAGASLIDLFKEVVSWTVEQMAALLAALIEAGRQLTEFIGATFKWTYKLVSKFVEAAFAAGLAIADLLSAVISESYFVLRRFVNGIIKNLGPIGDILNFVLTQVENATSALWRSTLLAIRYAKGSLVAALDWMAAQTEMAFEGIIRAWESIGEALNTLYEWALSAGAAVWRAIGEATTKIGNSIYYAYNFLTTTATEFIFDFTRGLLDAGMAIAGLISWAVTKTVEACAEVIRAALDAGLTIANMLVEIARDPGNAMSIFIQGIKEVGKTLEDLFQAVVIDTAGEFLDEVVETLVALGDSIVEIGKAALKVGGAALAAVIAALFNLLGSFRPLSANERADAQLAFGNSLDYDNIFLSTEDPLNKIIFGIQDLFTQNPDSRAFVTMNLINFDVSDGPIDRPTLIHELTHVWQSKEVGGIYMAEAIIAQTDLGSGYNYGYDDFRVNASNSININDRYDSTMTNYDALGSILGRNGEAALIASGGNFNAFNREQQGQIMMHWLVRKHLNKTDALGNPVTFDTAALDPYQQFVFNS